MNTLQIKSQTDVSSPAEPGLADLETIFPGDSEMAGRMRAFEWSASALGSTHDWPENLRVAIRLCLTSRFPICLWWARPLRFLYNDAFRSWLSDTKHLRALMQLGREVWSEDWHIIEPMLERVLATGNATWSEDVELYHNRHVPQEEVYITWSFTPILAADGHTVDGIFCPCSETTEKVIGARRLETLRKLAVRASEARSVDAACDEAVAVLGENARDIPFAAIYVATNGDDARLSAAVLPRGEHCLPSTVRASDDDAASPWPLAWVLRTKRAADCLGIDARGVQLHAGPWPDLTQTALVVPIQAAHDNLAGLLVVGVSPRRPLDAAYRTFFDLVAGHIATAISGAQAYEAQRERAEALAELDRAKTAFFSNVSHEFRTPLTLMLGPIEDILARADDEFTVSRDELDLVHRNTLRLLKLVNTLLDFSRIEAGRIEAVYEPTDLATYTVELASVFRSAIEKAGLKLIVECPPLPEPIYIDREMWEKIAFNLLSNAFKFTFQGVIKVELRWQGNHVELKVADTGVGIPEAELPHIFERFHRIRDIRSRTHEGTGIGLSLVQELVKLHAGEVRVESKEGGGTTFFVSVPIGAAHLPRERIGVERTMPSTAMGATPFVEEALRWLPDVPGGTGSIFGVQSSMLDAESRQLEGGERIKDERSGNVDNIPQSKIRNLKSKILVADDNADMRQYVRRILASRYEVTTVADGLTALDAIGRELPDLIVADVMMPKLDGFGLLRAVRSDARLVSVPVVMLSARAGEEATVEGMQAGADDYLAKPFSASELLARVSARLEIARANRAALEREHKLRLAAEQAEVEVARKNDELRDAYGRTESVLASVADTHILFDQEWRYIYVNDAAARAIDRPREQILGRTLWELYPDIAGTELDRQYRRAMENRVPMAFDFHYPRTDAWWANRFYPVPEGLAVFATNITDRKRVEEVLGRAREELEQRVIDRTRELSALNEELTKEIAERECAEQRLRRSENYLSEGQRLTKTGIWAWNSSTGDLFWSEQEFSIFGLDPQKGTPSPSMVLDLIHPDDRSFVQQRLENAVRETKDIEWDCRVIASDGTIKNVHTTAHPVFASGMLTEYVGTTMDITARKQAEDALHEAREELTRVSRAVTIGELAASIAHEVNQPLSAVVTNGNAGLRWLAGDAPNLDEARQALRRIIRDGNRASDVIAKIRLLVQKTGTEKEQFDLKEAIAETVSLAQAEIRRREVAVRTELADDLPAVIGDRVQLQQVLLNLIMNGIDAMSCVSDRPREMIIVAVKDLPDEIRVSVRDSGTGFKAHDVDRLFEAFYTTKPQGIGVGLSISRSIIEAHGGRMWAVQNETLGATFQFTLPIHRDASA
jgi:PAS domain S-box-containing protein